MLLGARRAPLPPKNAYAWIWGVSSPLRMGTVAAILRLEHSEPSPRMKTLIAVLVAAAIGFGAGCLYLSRQHTAQGGSDAAAQSAWQQEKAYLEQALADARKRGPEVRTIDRTHTVTNRLAPQEILERLLQLRPDSDEDSQSRVFRQIVYYLQTMADLGREALPVNPGAIEASQVAHVPARALPQQRGMLARHPCALQTQATVSRAADQDSRSHADLMAIRQRL